MCDDGSTDDTLEFIREYSKEFSNIKIISHENRGIAITRIEMINIVQQDFLVFLDADDTLEEDAISNYMHEISKNGSRDIVCSKVKPKNNFLRIGTNFWGYFCCGLKYFLYHKKLYNVSDYIEDFNGVIGLGKWWCCFGKIFRVEFLKSLDYSKLLSNHCHEDVILLALILDKCKTFSFTPIYTYNYWFWKFSTSHDKKNNFYNETKIHNLMNILQDLTTKYPAINGKLDNLRKKYVQYKQS